MLEVLITPAWCLHGAPELPNKTRAQVCVSNVDLTRCGGALDLKSRSTNLHITDRKGKTQGPYPVGEFLFTDSFCLLLHLVSYYLLGVLFFNALQDLCIILLNKPASQVKNTMDSDMAYCSL